MSEMDKLMERHSNKQEVRTLFSAYRSVLHVLAAEAHWLRRKSEDGLDYTLEADLIESQARSLEQNFARQLRLRAGEKT